MSAIEGPYDVWLTDTLTSASSDIDTDVFVGYIISMLEEEDSTEEDTSEAITGLLCGVVEEKVAADLCSTIMDKWSKSIRTANVEPQEIDKSEQLSKMFGQQNLATVQVKTLSAEDRERKAAILAQFAQVSEDEEDDEEFPEDDGGSDSLMMKNVNKQEVADAERALREKAREESEKKKEKDKADRIAQKQKATERKETEKKRTQKGERRTR